MIGQGCLIYANDHKQQLPPDLGAISKEEELVPQVFISPFHNGAPMPPGLDPDQVAAWVNANSDYIYLGAGKTTSMGAEQILAYEKPGLRSGGMTAALYGDGHVETDPYDMLKDQIDRQANPGK
jgi:hypothetical protein